MIVGEADRRVEIKGFLMAGSFYLAPVTYVLIFRYALLTCGNCCIDYAQP
jgi:hypothetical protein